MPTHAIPRPSFKFIKLQINERLWVYTVYDKLSETEDANSNGHSHTPKRPQIEIYTCTSKFKTRGQKKSIIFTFKLLPV